MPLPPPDVGRAENWSPDEQFIYELAFYEMVLRKQGERKAANAAKRLLAHAMGED